MGFFSKLFGKKTADQRVGGMEDYMTLIRVYFQTNIATRLGITNLAMLPDLRTFKTTLHVPTLNNKLGLGEKKQCKKMLKELYKMDENFFEEIDGSIKKNVKKIQDLQPYMYQFQGFTQDLSPGTRSRELTFSRVWIGLSADRPSFLSFPDVLTK